MLMVFAGTFAIFAVYLVNFIMMFFGASIGFIHDNGLFGIGFSLLVVCIAALNLVLDFDYIEQGAEQGAPKYLEWYGAFSLMAIKEKAPYHSRYFGAPCSAPCSI